jgi:hypothetical protein
LNGQAFAVRTTVTAVFPLEVESTPAEEPLLLVAKAAQFAT